MTYYAFLPVLFVICLYETNAYTVRRIRQVGPTQQRQLAPQFGHLPPQLAPSQQIRAVSQQGPPPQFGAPQLSNLNSPQQPRGQFNNFNGFAPPAFGQAQHPQFQAFAPGLQQPPQNQPIPSQINPSQAQIPQNGQPNGFLNQQFQHPTQGAPPQLPPQQTPTQSSNQQAPASAQGSEIPAQSLNQPQQPNPSLQEGAQQAANETTTTAPAPRVLPTPVDKNIDLDGDGALSLPEVQYAAFVHHGLSSSVVENLFSEVDRNKDGYLSSIEFNEIRPLVLAKAENAALRYLQNVDLDHNGLLSLSEAQAYILKEYGISNRDVERIWRLVVPSSNDEMDAVLFSKLRRRIRGMSIRLARQIMKIADKNEDGHIDLKEAQAIAFEQEGIGAGDVIEMTAGVDDNNDGELNAPEFADFQRIVRARAVETAKKALKVVDTDASDTLTMTEARQIAFDHYGFDEATLEPFFAQADENEDGQLDAVEFAGFRSVIRSRAVKNALSILPEIDEDGNGLVSLTEAEKKARRDDDLDTKEIQGLFSVADQDRSNQLDKVELADFVRLVRLSAIKYVNDHFRDYDKNRDKLVTIEELEHLVKERYKVDATTTRRFFDKVDIDRSGDLNAGEIVDFRHEIRRYVSDRSVQAELEEQSRREMAEIDAKLKKEADDKRRTNEHKQQEQEEDSQDDSEAEKKPTSTPLKPSTTTKQPNEPMKEAKEENTDGPQNDKEEDNEEGETSSQEENIEETIQRDSTNNNAPNAENATKSDDKEHGIQENNSNVSPHQEAKITDVGAEHSAESAAEPERSIMPQETSATELTNIPTESITIAENTTVENEEPETTTEAPQTSQATKKSRKPKRKKTTVDDISVPTTVATTTTEPTTLAEQTTAKTSIESSPSTESATPSTQTENKQETSVADSSTSGTASTSLPAREAASSAALDDTTASGSNAESSHAPEMETTAVAEHSPDKGDTAQSESLPSTTAPTTMESPSTAATSETTKRKRKRKQKTTTTTTTAAPEYDDDEEEEGTEESENAGNSSPPNASSK